MTQSYYASDRQVIKKRAYGYHKKESGYVNKTAISFTVPFSSGSLMSTISDMLKWQNALNKNLLLNAEETGQSLQPIQTKQRRNLHLRLRLAPERNKRHSQQGARRQYIRIQINGRLHSR